MVGGYWILIQDGPSLIITASLPATTLTVVVGDDGLGLAFHNEMVPLVLHRGREGRREAMQEQELITVCGRCFIIYIYIHGQ